MGINLQGSHSVAAYHEALTWNKLLGVGICLAGLVFINLK